MWHWPLKIMRIGLMVVGACVLVYWAFEAAVRSSWPVEDLTLESANSPNGAAAARVSRFNAGAFMSYRFMVYLKARGSTEEKEVFRGSRLEDLHIKWESDDKLTVSMRCGDVLNFRNDFYLDPQLEKRIDIGLIAPGHCRDR